MSKYQIILASGSPRRRELLGQIGLEFQVCVSDVEEVITSTDPSQIVEELSRQKAMAVYERVTEHGFAAKDAGNGEAAEKSMEESAVVVIGADTIVACDGLVLGKPKSREDAIAMLTRLQGRTHHVFTGVTLCLGDKPGQSHTFHEETVVSFYPMSREEIESYVDSGEPMDKAGAYGIQGLGTRYIRGIEGDYHNVVGLPVGRLYQEMRQFCGEAL